MISHFTRFSKAEVRGTQHIKSVAANLKKNNNNNNTNNISNNNNLKKSSFTFCDKDGSTGKNRCENI